MLDQNQQELIIGILGYGFANIVQLLGWFLPMCKANDTEFKKTPNAPAVILDACGAVADIDGSENWHSKLLQHQRLIEDAVEFKRKEAV